MNRTLRTVVAASLAAVLMPLAAQQASKEAKEDAVRHRAMAAAHTAAAQCMESGKPHDQCIAALQQACKGIAIGKYCGMKHAH